MTTVATECDGTNLGPSPLSYASVSDVVAVVVVVVVAVVAFADFLLFF